MSIVQWLFLILVAIAVIGAYVYVRRQAASDPWRDMDEPEEALEDSTSMNGDSYVVGVRTLNRETPADRKAAATARAEHRQTQTPMDDVPDRTRAVGQPTAVRRRPAPPEAEPAPLKSEPRVRSSELEPPRGLWDDDDYEATDVSDAGAHDDRGDTPHRALDEAAAPRRARKRGRKTPEPREAEPALALETPGREPAAGTAQRVDMVAPQPSAESEVFILHVAAPPGHMFAGMDVHDALVDCGLKFGLNDMYHRVTEAKGVTESVFAVTNMVKPGTLHPIEAETLATPGLSMFLLVPGPIEGRTAMHDMMETAHRLTTHLGGTVLDDKRALLKAQTAQFMLDQIAEIDRRARIAKRRR